MCAFCHLNEHIFLNNVYVMPNYVSNMPFCCEIKMCFSTKNSHWYLCIYMVSQYPRYTILMYILSVSNLYADFVLWIRVVQPHVTYEDAKCWDTQELCSCWHLADDYCIGAEVLTMTIRWLGEDYCLTGSASADLILSYCYNVSPSAMLGCTQHREQEKIKSYQNLVSRLIPRS